MATPEQQVAERAFWQAFVYNASRNIWELAPGLAPLDIAQLAIDKHNMNMAEINELRADDRVVSTITQGD